MINAEIHCDIVLKFFVPKVVPQPWRPPCLFKRSNRIRWAYLTQVASQWCPCSYATCMMDMVGAFHDVCGPMWSLFLIEHLYNLSGIRQGFKLRMDTKRTCLIMTLCLKHINYSSFNGRSSVITSKKKMKKKSFDFQSHITFVSQLWPWNWKWQTTWSRLAN